LASVEVTEFHTTDVYDLVIVVTVVMMAEIEEMREGEGGGEKIREAIYV
jgi:hypothetical protein